MAITGIRVVTKSTIAVLAASSSGSTVILIVAGNQLRWRPKTSVVLIVARAHATNAVIASGPVVLVDARSGKLNDALQRRLIERRNANGLRGGVLA